MRTFIALEFDENTKKKICDVQKLIRDNSSSGRFKYVDNFHITLKFLGEISSASLKKMYEELNINLKDISPLNVKINNLGCFGEGDKISTIYLKVEDKSNTLYKICDIVEETCEKNGFKRDRKFVPHVTIAQEVMLNIPFVKVKDQANDCFDENISFNKITIMKSEQVGVKRIYTPLYNINLKEGTRNYDYKRNNK